MNLQSNKMADGTVIFSLGSLENKNIILIVEREDFTRDLSFVSTIAKALAKENRTIIWRQPSIDFLDDILDPKGLYQHWPTIPRKIIKALTMLMHPRRCRYYMIQNFFHISYRCKELKRFIGSLGADKDITILSRSAGGRVASLIADALHIQRHICLGYPFKHPQRSLEPKRFAHLAGIKTPTLIIQGIHDEYGGLEVAKNYQLSPHIQLSFIETDHNFVVSQSMWEDLLERIRSFIET